MRRDPPNDDEAAGELLRGVGARVREARHERGLTQGELAAASGVGLRFLGQLEAGEGNISLARLDGVARALDLPLAALVAEGSGVLPHGITSRVVELVRRKGPEGAARALDLAAALVDPRGGTRVALLGIRGAGKTSVGQRLAAVLGVPFVELDALVERLAGLSLGQIFELHGEGYYRRLERLALAELIARPAFVVATGGSIVTSPEHLALLGGACLTVWLRATPDDHWARVVAQGDARPMRRNPRAMDELRALFAARSPLYAQAAVCVDTPGKSVDEVAHELASLVEGGAPRARAEARESMRE